MTADERLKEITEHVRCLADEGHQFVGHFGAIKTDAVHTWWSIRMGDAVSKCLVENPDHKVAQVLSVLGSEHRLAILRLILDGPKTAAEVVAALGFRTTGQAYHHIHELERAGYVKQSDGGRYEFVWRNGRLYLSALNLAADGGAEDGD
jgi:DNA-binding transcriptional ArsR family regulator